MLVPLWLPLLGCRSLVVGLSLPPKTTDSSSRLAFTLAFVEIRPVAQGKKRVGQITHGRWAGVTQMVTAVLHVTTPVTKWVVTIRLCRHVLAPLLHIIIAGLDFMNFTHISC
jgi:hypothetical protein